MKDLSNIIYEIHGNYGERGQDSINARKALSRLTGNDVELLTWDEKYQYFKGIKFPVSLSHTKGLALASLDKSSLFSSIGCDIELSERKVNQSSLELIENDKDSYDNLVKYWCLKEAAFKCIYSFNKNIKMKDIEVQFDKVSYLGQELFSKFETKDIMGRSFIVTFVAI